VAEDIVRRGSVRRWNPPPLPPPLCHTPGPRAPPGTSRTRKSAMAEAVHVFETAVRHNIKVCAHARVRARAAHGNFTHAAALAVRRC
jgi:hypothetical protein